MTPAQRQAAHHGFRAQPSTIVAPGLRRGPAAFPATGTAAMTPDQAQTIADQLTHAMATDDEDAGSKAAVQLLVGIAVNIARIAEALCPSPPSG